MSKNNEFTPSNNVVELPSENSDFEPKQDQEGPLPIEGGDIGQEEQQEEQTETSIFDRLFSTEPNRPLSEIENIWSPDQGGTTRIYRGIQKMGDFSGLPAILDLIIGSLELLQNDEFNEITENTNRQKETSESNDVNEVFE